MHEESDQSGPDATVERLLAKQYRCDALPETCHRRVVKHGDENARKDCVGDAGHKPRANETGCGIAFHGRKRYRIIRHPALSPYTEAPLRAGSCRSRLLTARRRLVEGRNRL